MQSFISPEEAITRLAELIEERNNLHARLQALTAELELLRRPQPELFEFSSQDELVFEDTIDTEKLRSTIQRSVQRIFSSQLTEVMTAIVDDAVKELKK
jgi:hypothetical protein